MRDKTQKIQSYISASGIRVFETIQYNKATNDWYIVGDSSTDPEFIMSQIRLHNSKLPEFTEEEREAMKWEVMKNKKNYNS